MMKAKNHISYRGITDEDKPFLYKLYASTRDDVEQFAQSWSDDQKTAFLQMQFEAQDAHYKKYHGETSFQIIRHRKKDVGRLYLEERQNTFCIIDITLEPNFRGRGIGGAIMNDIIEMAHNKDKKVTIHVARNNQARHLYDRLGFTVVEEGDVYNLMEKVPEKKNPALAQKDEKIKNQSIYNN